MTIKQTDTPLLGRDFPTPKKTQGSALVPRSVGESLLIGASIEIRVHEVRNDGRVVLAVNAPRNLRIDRSESSTKDDGQSAPTLQPSAK